MPNKKLQLRDAEGNLLFPRTSLDNIQESINDGTSVTLARLVDGKLPSEYFPDGQVDVVVLLTIGSVAPATCSAGDKYYNNSNNTIYTAPADNTWSDDASAKSTPEVGKLYVNLNTNTLWRYNGTNDMIEISAHFEIVQTIDASTEASTTEVPSEKAVSLALENKQTKLTAVSPIDINAGSSISLAYGQGLSNVDDTLTVPQSYVVDTVSTQMLEDSIAATPEQALVQGGTVYTIMGSYEVTDEIRPSSTADDTFIATEKAVRDAVNAYVATGGTEIVAGDGITVENGAINIDDATAEEVLTDNNEGAAIDDKVVTPDNLKGALSVGQAVDVSCNAIASSYDTIQYEGDETLYPFTSDTFKNDTSKYLGTFTIRKTAAANADYLFGFNGSSSKFPKSADGLKYLMIMDIKNTGSLAWSSVAGSCRMDGYGYDSKLVDGVPADVPASAKAAGQTEFTRVACIFRGNEGRGYIVFRVQAAGTLEVTIKNWRQYEVTALTDEAIAYIAKQENPDEFFRNTNAYTLLNKYLIRQDMVAPFIPVISMPDNSDLTIGAGLAYSLKYTDNNTHKITVDTFPENGYGWDAHLRLFVNNASLIQFMPPLNLLSPLTPNAGHNLTVKFRSGQANVYVDDTDIGYVVTVTSGSDNGSLAYGLANASAGDYIVFSTATDDQDITMPEGTKFGLPMNIIGNGTDKTIITSPVDYTTDTDHKYGVLNLVNIAIKNTTIDADNGSYLAFNARNILIDSCVSGNTDGRTSIRCAAIADSTVSNCSFTGNGLIVANMTNCTVSGNICNTAYSQTILVYMTAASQVVPIQNCVVSGNTSNYTLDMLGPGTTTVTGSTFTDNVPITAGSATVVVGNGSTTATKGILTDNTFTNTDIEVKSGSTVTFSGVNVLNSTVSGAGNIVFANGSTVTSTGDGSEGNPHGTFSGAGRRVTPTVWDGTTKHVFQNVEFIKGYITAEGAGIYVSHSCDFINCVITGNTSTTNNAGGFACRTIYNQVPSTINITGSTFNGNSNPGSSIGNLLLTQNGSTFNITNSIIQRPYFGTHGFYNVVDSKLVGNMVLDSGASHTVIINIEGMCDLQGMQRYNPDLGVFIFRYISGSTVTNTAAIPAALDLQMSVGSYDASNPYLWTVNGSFTVVMPNGTASISGIGTYINNDGSNDFSTPYMVVNTSSSGSGSLLNGINDTTSTYVVIDHSVTDTSAVVNGDVSAVKMFCTGDGRTIVGGTVGLAEGSTVSVHTTVDEHGAAQVAGSTVTVVGSSATLSGTCTLGGTFTPAGGLVIANGSTISGVAGGRISGCEFKQGINSITLRNLTIEGYDPTKNMNFNMYGTGTKLISGCTISNTSHALYFQNNTNPIVENCTITARYGICIINNDVVLRLKNLTSYNGNAGNWSVDILNYSTNCAVVFEGYCRLQGKVGLERNTSDNKIYIISGSTINFSNNTVAKPFAIDTVSVGTMDNNNVFTTGGTAYIITNSGTTVAVSGTGTYIGRDGTNDLA